MDFQGSFREPLDEEASNDSHQVVVVAAALDASAERTTRLLNRRGVTINVLFFRVVSHGDQKSSGP